MTTLRIANDLRIPLDVVTETLGILGIKGSGKTTTAKVLTEELTKAGQQVAVIDPLGVWYGLRSSADGQSAGLPFVILGGDHGDVPLESTAGELVADFVIAEHVPVVLDLSLFRKAEMRRFTTAFLSRLYHRNREPLHLMIDEADLFAPQRPGKDETALLGAMEDLIRRGRAKGIGATLITQRPAVIHKDVLTQISTLVCMRISGPQDRNALNEWVRANGTDEQRDEMIASLASLPTGTAWFWSPHWLGIFQRVQVRRLETFDSSATPKAGERRNVPKAFAAVDLAGLQERMAATIERAKQDDPHELRRRIGELEKQIHSQPSRIEKVVERVEVPVLGEHERRLLKDLNEKLDSVGTWLQAVKRDVAPVLAQVTVTPTLPAPVIEPEPVKLPSSPRRTTGNSGPVESGELSAPQQRILDALACFERVGISSVARANVAVWADQSPRSSGYTNNLGRLRTLGMIEYPTGGVVTLTDRGRELATCLAAITSVTELHAAWFAKLSNPQARILRALIHIYPRALRRSELADAAGQSATSSGYTNNLGMLRGLGLLDYPRGGEVVATGLLFPEGLA